MTPENLAKAASLHTQLSSAEKLLGRLNAQGLEQRRRAYVELSLSFNPDVRRGDPVLEADAATGLLQNMIDTTKDELRALGVVFEPVDAVMPEIKEKWGAEIVVDGKRPDWLRDDEQVSWRWTHRGFEHSTSAELLNWAGSRTQPNPVHAIRLPADHPYYTATEKGFTYWPGGDQAPDDWDGGKVLCRDPMFDMAGDSPRCWGRFQGSPGRDIIGYKRRAQPEAPFTDDVDPASRDPKTPDHLTITLTGPQGCGKTVVANWLFGAVAYWNGNEDADAAHRFISLESAFKGKRVTIIDGSDR